ncbi:MAG: 6,7-dimethyl-8-ribityllumazine synthase [Actinomycetia bacterium]|nr:6,7-dimethyl-8-ribityllumazine synthase [Actinomycetes bacterium]
MSGAGAPQSQGRAPGRRVAILAASWHEDVMDGLLAGARRSAQASEADVAEFRVPGAFELPVVAKRAIAAGFEGVVALGVVIRGGTPHFEYVSQAVTSGLTQVAAETGVPVGFGVLTCDDEAQALDRAGLPGSSEDKGAEAFDAVVSTLTTLNELSYGQRPYPGFTPA